MRAGREMQGDGAARELAAWEERQRRLLELERREDDLIRWDIRRERLLEDFQTLAQRNLYLIDFYGEVMPGLLRRAHVDDGELRHGAMRAVERMEDDLEEGRRERKSIRAEEDRVEKECRAALLRAADECEHGAR